MEFVKEHRLVLKNYGKVDPTSFDDYLAVGGYEAMEKVIDMTQEDIIRELKISGLRGRGGAGFPTWLKWSFTAPILADQKYIICNADEGEPGTYKDRLIMDHDPHLLIEAMTIAGFTLGASKGYIYLRGEYPQSRQSLERAISNARDFGFLGEDIFNSGFDFDIEVFSGGYAFVCGEETAIIESIEGKRGEPRFRPPYPGVSGLWGKPTVVNNVETLANIPGIILNGGEWFSKIGAPNYSGTKIITLSGDVKNRTFAEVPTDITLNDVINIIGGGVTDGKFQAVQVGGNSGGILPESLLETQIDFDSMSAAGGSLGTGAVFVLNDTRDLMDVVKTVMHFFAHESCGKCTPCREGCQRLHDFTIKFCEGKATAKDIRVATNLAHVMTQTSLCGLGQAAPTPLLTALRFFGDKFEEKLAKS